MSRYILARKFGTTRGVGASSVAAIETSTVGMFIIGAFVGGMLTWGGLKYGYPGASLKDKISDLNKKYQTHTAKG